MNYDEDSRKVAAAVAAVAASGLHQLATHLGAEAAAIVLMQGGNVAGTVIIPPGLSPAELGTWASSLARELRVLADDVENGDTRRELERQANAYRAKPA